MTLYKETGPLLAANCDQQLWVHSPSEVQQTSIGYELLDEIGRIVSNRTEEYLKQSSLKPPIARTVPGPSKVPLENNRKKDSVEAPSETAK